MSEQLSRAVAGEIRRLLDERGMSGRELSRQTGISPRSMNRKLSGEQPIDLDDLPPVCQVLGVSVTDLMGWSTQQ